MRAGAEQAHRDEDGRSRARAVHPRAALGDALHFKDICRGRLQLNTSSGSPGRARPSGWRNSAVNGAKVGGTRLPIPPASPAAKTG